MSPRLEKAVEQLSPEKVEQVAEFAESLVAQDPSRGGNVQFLKLDWVGKGAAAYPEHSSGVEAAHSIASIVTESLERPNRS